jgi:hypothetical protein
VEEANAIGRGDLAPSGEGNVPVTRALRIVLLMLAAPGFLLVWLAGSVALHAVTGLLTGLRRGFEGGLARLDEAWETATTPDPPRPARPAAAEFVRRAAGR